jgi:hypothetical protein
MRFTCIPFGGVSKPVADSPSGPHRLSLGLGGWAKAQSSAAVLLVSARCFLKDEKPGDM